MTKEKRVKISSLVDMIDRCRFSSNNSQNMSYCVTRNRKLLAKKSNEKRIQINETSNYDEQKLEMYNKTLKREQAKLDKPIFESQIPTYQSRLLESNLKQRLKRTATDKSQDVELVNTSCQECRRNRLPSVNDDDNTAVDEASSINSKQHLKAIKINSKSSATSWTSLVIITILSLLLTDWSSLEPQLNELSYEQQDVSWSLLRLLPIRNIAPRSKSILAKAQYSPIWPNKDLQQEIFLLNLEDGYFGCQVNESQDFLQLFELSKLCDGQTQCYLGTDELVQPLKCTNRDRCGVGGNGGVTQFPKSTNLLNGLSTSLTANNWSNNSAISKQRDGYQCVNGVCLDGLCYCNDGWGGKSCDIPDENECKFRPCDVFAHCTNTMGSYYCSCFPGYDGDGMHCQDINECEIPSLAALCSDNSECCNLPGHFVCKCKPGYQQLGAGQSALTNIDECLDERACGRGALCENLPGSFRCACPPGFTGDPAVECIDMDECRNNPCGIGAQCTNIPGGYRCSCAPGFERNPALPASLFGSLQTSALVVGGQQPASADNQQLAVAANSSLVACLDINECSLSGKSVCGLGAQCVNTPGGYFCQCPPNFTGNPKVACQDIDECQNQACGSNTLCRNTPGSYKCECKQGYTGNPYLAEGCQDEDECLRKEACGLNAQCFNSPGSYQCSCLNGFRGDPYSKCEDVNECADRNKSPCGPGAQCVNLEGSYRCSCPEKYLARGTPEMGCERAAVDIGCSADLDCSANALCLNSTCQCRLGYQINGIDCVDVDECSLGQPALPAAPPKPFTKIAAALASGNSSAASGICGPQLEASCHNTDGSYACHCRAGYEKQEPLSATSKCRDINECEANPNACGQNSNCFNTEGSFKCACSDGFIPIEPEAPERGCKSPCEGIDCGKHATCKPHGQEAACVCKPGFTFDPNNIKLGCVDINECDTNYGASGLCGQRAICTNVPGSYRCNCPSGFSGDAYRYCEDINECDRRYGIFGQCGELAVCNNTAGSFTCSCASGYQGDPRVKCQDIDECAGKGSCGANALCTNLPGKFACSCPEGYSGDPEVRCKPEAPACARNQECPANQLCQSGRCQCPFAQPEGAQDCRHPCERSQCGAHATCQLDAENQPLCVCEAGYMAPGDGRSGCIDVNECIQGVALTGVTPLAALNSARGAGGPPAVTLSPLASQPANGSHPCGRNALCHNLPGTFDCVCPPGYSGDAYQACTLDVRNQQLSSTTASHSSSSSTSSSTSQTGSAFGNYVQEPRTSTCAEACPRGSLCSEGRCVKPDACRDNLDCGPTMACEHVSQQLGFQCVNVCELNQCGPEAKCTPLNHKPVCSCNASAGYAGDPYDLINGCQLYELSGPAKSTPADKQQLESERPLGANQQQLPADQLAGTIHFQQPGSNVSQQEEGQPGRKPALVTYELPLPTTPFNQPAYSGHTQSPFGLQQQQPAAGEQRQSVGSNKISANFTKTITSSSSLSTGSLSSTTKQSLFQVGARKTTPTPAGNIRQEGLEEKQDAFGQLASNTSSQQHQQHQQHQQLLQQVLLSQLACANDQHCPGNLFCLAEGGLRGNQKLCGCPPSYRREGDYCYMTRVNCSSSALCRPREDCVSGALLLQHHAAAGSQQFNLQQVAGSGDELAGICICPRGFRLTASGLACVDRNECDEGAPCAVGAVCQNKVGSYECVCPPGTIGEPYTKTCEPISRQECQSSLDCPNDRECDLSSRKCVSPCRVCGPRAICTAANHAAICLCPPKFTGNAIDLVYGCQEPAPPTTTVSSLTGAAGTTARPTPARQQQETSTALGVPVTTLLPATTQSPASSPDSSTTSQSVEFRTIPPSELFVMCLADGIQVELQLGGFDGIIYVKGHSQDPKCRKLVSSSNANEFVDFKVHFGHCDLIHRDGEAGFVLVIQKHPKLVTYRARAYHVKCVYNTGERTVTLGFNVSMITTSGTIANTGPPPTCLMSITSLNGHEVTSAEIGQDLLLRVDVQPDSIYGGFARSCEAKTMDDDGEYQYEVTDANGCATDPSIFSDWKYDQQQKSLVARFNAFKFPSSNNLRFQCNIRVCFGSCPAVNCNGVDAYGRRRRRRSAMAIEAADQPNRLNSSLEDELPPGTDELIVSDAFKEGALREEIMIQSNAILTFDKKEASLAQKRPQVEDIEFVCLPRLGILMSILLTTLIALLALAIATSCWCFKKRLRQNTPNGPLPHPMDFPNPLLRSTSSSTLSREPIYGP